LKFKELTVSDPCRGGTKTIFMKTCNQNQSIFFIFAWVSLELPLPPPWNLVLMDIFCRKKILFGCIQMNRNKVQSS
jgi:hypothetical protein